MNSAIYAKLEYLNPAGSIKDRAALYMIMDAEDKGLLKKGYTIIEPTSGNTGIGLSAISASRGYKVILTMPDTMSEERRKLLKAYGAEIILTSGDKGMSGAVAKANELLGEIENSIILGQFSNNANALAHYETTAPEIYADTRGDVDFIVAGIGTGGTLTGIARFFKEKKPDTKIIGVEPSDSPLLTKGVSGPHKLQGIGANFIPSILNKENIFEASSAKYAKESAKETFNEIANILKSGKTDYEFRTTVVREFHDEKRLIEAAEMIKGAEKYFLQGFIDSGELIGQDLHGFTGEEMEQMKKAVCTVVPNTQLRGI